MLDNKGRGLWSPSAWRHFPNRMQGEGPAEVRRKRAESGVAGQDSGDAQRRGSRDPHGGPLSLWLDTSLCMLRARLKPSGQGQPPRR